MAEGFLKSFDDRLEVFSAGTQPALQVHPKAVQVMSEAGINISTGYPKNVDEFLNQNFDFVITVCDEAMEVCPFFSGKVKYQLHLNFEDPDRATGTEEEIIEVFRKVRDRIRKEFYRFYESNIK
jgi:arsenate reductase